MGVLRIILLLLFINICIFTAAAVSNQGWDLITYFFGDIAQMGWAGQFNVDFMSYLSLSAIWIAWRHHFSASGLVLALIALVMGILVFAPYLLIVSFQVNGDVRALLLGEDRANA